MIQLTKLNKQPITINAMYIERVESTPDTIITLTTEKRILVLESVEEVTELATSFYQKISLFQEMKEVRKDVSE
jgi:flagellar protein FlbD